MTAVFRTQRLVEFADTDMAGIVHFSAFFRWMEAAEHAFLRSRGLSVSMDWEGRHLSFPRVSAACDFHRPAHFEDVLDVEVRLERLGTRSVSYSVEFSRRGERIASGRLSTVCCRVGPEPGAIESVPIPEGMQARLLDDPPPS
jgi:YbgC/YbaW family acyl-CoA thioester hydrolase